MLFCIANGTLSQVQSKKVKKLSGQNFSPLVERVAKGVVIGLQNWPDHLLAPNEVYLAYPCRFVHLICVVSCEKF